MDSVFEYETHRQETSWDTSFHVSQDGKRGMRKGINIGLKKRKVKPSDLVDAYGDWIPLPGDDENQGPDPGDEEDVDGAETGGKRKRYESSVSCVCLCPPFMN